MILCAGERLTVSLTKSMTMANTMDGINKVKKKATMDITMLTISRVESHSTTLMATGRVTLTTLLMKMAS